MFGKNKTYGLDLIPSKIVFPQHFDPWADETLRTRHKSCLFVTGRWSFPLFFKLRIHHKLKQYQTEPRRRFLSERRTASVQSAWLQHDSRPCLSSVHAWAITPDEGRREGTQLRLSLFFFLKRDTFSHISQSRSAKKRYYMIVFQRAEEVRNDSEKREGNHAAISGRAAAAATLRRFTSRKRFWHWHKNKPKVEKTSGCRSNPKCRVK